MLFKQIWQKACFNIETHFTNEVRQIFENDNLCNDKYNNCLLVFTNNAFQLLQNNCYANNNKIKCSIIS